MGQDSSTPVDPSTPPSTLSSRTLEGVAEYLRSGRCRRVVVMTGAGISTSAGIPDFRSPETGLYANLARLDLPYAEAVFDISYFRQNPDPFYALAHELYPGKYRPTVAHSFVALLQRKGLLHMLFTQNIDCLEREAGVGDERVVEAHGSFATQRCIDCKTEYPDALMREAIAKKEVPRCSDRRRSGNPEAHSTPAKDDGAAKEEAPAPCNGLVKPDIVFFGEQLPPAFFSAARTKPHEADLCIVMGTSLTVQPFASLPQLVPESCPRVLVNLERVGGLGSRADDVLLLGQCDDGVRRLAEACGWREELEEEWAKTAPKAALDKLGVVKEEEKMSKDERLQDEIDKLTRDVDETLKLNDGHREAVERQLDKTKDEEPGVSKGKATASAGSPEPKANPTTTAGTADKDSGGASRGGGGVEKKATL